MSFSLPPVLVPISPRLAPPRMTDNNNRSGVNINDQPYVVGILSPSTTLYIDQAGSDNGNDAGAVVLTPPSDLNLERRSTTSFQITSVTVQGSRRNDDNAYDSCDDLDESHTDDLSSDILDSSRGGDLEGGYHSEDTLDELQSPPSCGPIIFQLPSPDRNMNLSIGVTPTFAAISPVAGGVTMMTSKSESPISAQVPIMNPLPNNWQRRFKVVKIVSSEPFRRGRWLCMDFKDPPVPDEASRAEKDGRSPPPTIQITNCDPDEALPQEGYLDVENLARLYEIPISQGFRGNFILGNQQHMYGIILPQSEFLQPVTLVDDMSLQTSATDRNFNNLVNHHQGVLVQGDQYVPYMQGQHVLVNNNNNNNNNVPGVHPSPPHTQVLANHQYAAHQDAVHGHGRNNMSGETVVPPMSPRSRSNSGPNRIPCVTGMETEETESFAGLDNELSRASGLLPRTMTSPAFVTNGNYYPYPPDNISDGNALSPKGALPIVRPPFSTIQQYPPIMTPPAPYVDTFPSTDYVVNNIPKAPTNTFVPPPTVVANANSSQTTPEKHPSEVGQEVDPSGGSTVPTGANTVAIDNKIEQAMDLVKSHLMFAVREEVEVLKEKITELLERISQLEHENDILRANASAETLKQLNSHKKAGGAALPPPST